MSDKNDQKLVIQNYQGNQKSNKKNYLINTLKTNPLQIIDQEEIQKRNNLTEENHVSKDEFNTSRKRTNIIHTLRHVNTKTKISSFHLNSYWIDLLGSISLAINLILYEYIANSFLNLLNSIIESEDNIMENVGNFIDLVFQKIGFKWFFFITMSEHLSVGFFCLTTFSELLNETKNIKKFYIINAIKIAVFYALTIVIFEVIIKKKLGNFFFDKIREMGIKLENIDNFFNLFIDKLVRVVEEFLSTFNIFLEKLVFGTIYICLFNSSKLFFCRLLALLPILYVIICQILRALYNYEKININIYVLPFLLGSKITVYIFFISTLLIIKFMSEKYEVFDKNNEIYPKVFNKIGSRNYSVIGIIELIIGLFLPSWSSAGIGGDYLLILCAPLMALYDYKIDYVLKFPCCKKGNMTLCIKIGFLVISWAFIIIYGGHIIKGFGKIFKEYLLVIITIIQTNYENAVQSMNSILDQIF